MNNEVVLQSVLFLLNRSLITVARAIDTPKNLKSCDSTSVQFILQQNVDQVFSLPKVKIWLPIVCFPPKIHGLQNFTAFPMVLRYEELQ